MLKKLAGLTVAGALVLAVVAPVLAHENVAIIKGNDATATANTGWNIQANGTSVLKAGVDGSVTNSGNNNMTTGNAKARAGVLIVANTNVGCGDVCEEGNAGSLNSGGNLAVVKRNDATAGADSGWNIQANGTSVEKAHVDGSVTNSGDNNTTTGNAKAKAKVWIVVNSNWSF